MQHPRIRFQPLHLPSLMKCHLLKLRSEIIVQRLGIISLYRQKKNKNLRANTVTQRLSITMELVPYMLIYRDASLTRGKDIIFYDKCRRTCWVSYNCQV